MARTKTTLWKVNQDIAAVVQSLSHVLFFVIPWTAAGEALLSFTISWSLLKLMSIESVMPSNHLILCHPFLEPSIFFQHEGLFRMKKQTVMSQIKGKDKILEKQLNEADIGNLPEKVLRTMIVKMIQDLRKVVELQLQHPSFQ